MLLGGAEPASKRQIVNAGKGSQACRTPHAPQGESSTRRKIRVPESPSDPAGFVFGDRIVAVGPSEGGPPLPRSGRNYPRRGAPPAGFLSSLRLGPVGAKESTASRRRVHHLRVQCGK